jgi:mersacidin/lichenicidin family type 2 lantibiotic
MKKQEVIRAWRDGEFFAGLSAVQQNAVPASPAAMIEVGDDVLANLTGGCSVGEGYCPTSAWCSPCRPYQCF